MQTDMADSPNPTAQQDASAVTAVRRGDAERYRELVERHERRVYAVAWSRLGDAALAEEVTQEAFIRAYRRLWLLGDGAKFAGWVSTIARRVAINSGLSHRRELNKRERWALEHPTEAASGTTSGGEDSPCPPETLRQTLAELPAAHRECLVLFYLEGRSGAEAAAALGISEAALRVRLHRARAALRERLEEKLAISLANLRPAQTLVPAIMAGVLAASSAKAATAGGAGAALVSALAKTGLAKWLLPLGSLFSFIFLLPMLLMSWLFTQMELKNFRDQQGFRARLFRSQIKDRLLLIIVAILVGLVIIPLIARLVERGNFSSARPETTFLVIAAFVGVFLPFSLRQLTINRNHFFMASAGSSLLIGMGCLLAGFGWLSASNVNLFIIAQALLTLPFYGQRPIRMDYNLFLRATEDLLPDSVQSFREARRNNVELLAFARFLGTRWLANDFRWKPEGLCLRLPPSNFSQWTGWTDLMFNWSWRCRSYLRLGWDGSVSAQLGQRDARALAKFHDGTNPIPTELEARVAAAVSLAWKHFAAGNPAAAERALGQVAEGDVFVASPARGGIAKARWPMAILLGLVVLSSIGLKLPGCRARMDGLRPVNLTEAQVRATLANYPADTTRNSLSNLLFNALFSGFVLPPTNLFTPEAFAAVKSSLSLFAGFSPDATNRTNLDRLHSYIFARPLTDGWLVGNEKGLAEAEVASFLKRRGEHEWAFGLLDLSLSQCHSGEKTFTLPRLDNRTLAQLRWLRDLNGLRFVDRERLVNHLVSLQVLNGEVSGNRPPLPHWRDLRGLFFLPGWPTLQDTYTHLAALEILGALDQVDREACIKAVLKLHAGKGLFIAPETNERWRLHISGDARDTFCAYESLRILGALDRVKDLEQWQFRPQRRGVAKDQVTWADIEAWVCQRRLENIIQARKENPAAPFGSLLAP